jgi:carboxypeptidase Taq
VAYPSEIRTEADELTYNLHILIRYEIETALLEDRLEVSELPETWNTKTGEYLGFVPPSASRGVLQDVHWAMGLFGYFPTYTLGNVLSAQIFEAATSAHPEIPDEMEQGRFGTLLGWLRENIHRHGRRYDPEDLIERATGRPMEATSYLSYLKEKFGELYDLG